MTARGLPFSYTISGDVLRVHRDHEIERNLTRENFRKAHELLKRGIGGRAFYDKIQGAAYAKAILQDSRVG